MSVVVVRYNGTDITSGVMFASANFTQQAGGIPGEFMIRIKDPDQTYSFITGKEITVDVDGFRLYGGYLFQAIRNYAFDADDTSAGDDYENRTWTLRGVDYNIIFDKRVIRNTNDYLHSIDTQLANSSQSGAAVEFVLANYVDIAGFDTTTYVNATTAGPIVSDTATGTFKLEQGKKLRDAFDTLVLFNGAIWYIDPDKNFVFQSLALSESRWGFSDAPNNNPVTASPVSFQGSTYGFREVEATEDGSTIVNDAMVWGGSVASGGNTYFKRQESAASQTEHGRWQYGEQRFSELGTQDAVDRRAYVIVEGDPGATGAGLLKGLKYSQWALRFTWFAQDVPLISGVPDHLHAGDLVTIDLSIFDETLLLPLRNLTISFPGLYENGDGIVQFDGEFALNQSDPYTLWRYILGAQKRISQVNTTTIVSTTTEESSSTTYGSQFAGVPTPAPNGVVTAFTIPFGYVAGTLRVWINGLEQIKGTSFTESDSEGGEFLFATPPVSTDELYVRAITLEGGASPLPPPPVGGVNVSSIAALKAALADDDVSSIIVQNGTYHVSVAAAQASDSLWIGAAFAGRTNPVYVRAETSGGVTFDGGGAAYFGGISFEEGAHDQTWDGFKFANGKPNSSGVIVFGGYNYTPAANITLVDITILPSCTSYVPGSNQDHGVYFANNAGDGHLIDGLTVIGASGAASLESAVHFFHVDNTSGTTIRNLTVSGTRQAIIIWESSLDITIENATITNAASYAVRYEAGTVTLDTVVSTGSGSQGFYSSLGPTPPGVTFISCSFG